MFVSTLKSILRLDFLRKEDGAIALETMIIIPVLFWGFMSAFSIFDAFRQYSMHQKAAYTISDMLSRETLAIDQDYLNGAHHLFNTLTRDPQDSTVRVSVVRWNDTLKAVELDWSKTVGATLDLSLPDLTNWDQRLPVMSHNERLIVVETSALYDPPFRTGLEQREITNFIFTRPRYAPQLLWLEDIVDEVAAGA